MSIFKKKQDRGIWIQEMGYGKTSLDLATASKGSRRIEVPFSVDEIETILLNAAKIKESRQGWRPCQPCVDTGINVKDQQAAFDRKARYDQAW